MDFIIGPADIPRWAISAPWRSNSGRLSQSAVSTKPGEVHLGWNMYCPTEFLDSRVEHRKLSFLQRIQSAASPQFLRDIKANSFVTLVRDPRLSSAALGYE